MYRIKTRNWNGKKWVKFLLDLSGVEGYGGADNDYKYIVETKSPVKAWTLFAYFMLLRHFSGGWTYIVLPGHDLKDGYKAIN